MRRRPDAQVIGPIEAEVLQVAGSSWTRRLPRFAVNRFGSGRSRSVLVAG
jgi:hypothetical protein